MDLKVVHIHPETRIVTVKVSSEFVSGVDLLIQIVVLSLLNDPGRSILDPAEGGGLPELIGSNLSMDDEEELYAEIQLRINKTKSEIINQQIGLELSIEEKLRDLTLLSIESGGNEASVYVRIRLENEAGRIIDLTV